MTSDRVTRVIAAIAGGAAILAMVGLTSSCAKAKEKPPATTTATTTAPTTAPSQSVNPTEKAPRIPSGPNTFSPTITAPAAPTAIPGNH